MFGKRSETFWEHLVSGVVVSGVVAGLLRIARSLRVGAGHGSFSMLLNTTRFLMHHEIELVPFHVHRKNRPCEHELFF